MSAKNRTRRWRASYKRHKQKEQRLTKQPTQTTINPATIMAGVFQNFFRPKKQEKEEQ